MTTTLCPKNRVRYRWTDDRLNDWIIDIAFAPVLDLYLKHPAWHVTLEMPALMLEIIGERHPDVLRKMRQGAATGQFEFVSFHWSDQLFLAFPALDMERSVQMTRAVFDRYCLPLSGAVFDQEGQSGPGKHAFMASHGYAIDLVNGSQFDYDQSGVQQWPYYTDNGVDVIVGSDGHYPAAGVDVTWTFLNDGELLAAPGDPYFAPVTPEPDESSIASYEAQVTDLESKGYRIGTLTDYVAHLKARGVAAKPMPAYVDGTWHPDSTENVHLWMGKRSNATYASHERDSFIRSTNYRVSRDVAATEILLDAARKAGKNVKDLLVPLDFAWRNLLKAEVSDATGITPWQGEFNYAVTGNDLADSTAKTMRDILLPRLGWKHAKVDLATGTAEGIDEVPTETLAAQPVAPLDVAVDAPTRAATTTWQRTAEGVDVLDVTFGPGSDPAAEHVEECRVTVTFPRFADAVIYTPALAEDRVVEQPFTDFAFGAPEVYLPLSNGLIGLGDGWWLVKDCRVFHVAARVAVSPAEKVVQFVDETADPLGGRWRFYVLKGTKEQALALANRVNITPILAY